MRGEADELRGRTCLVTGASSGMGEVIATDLAGRGASVVMLCRDPARGEAARRRVVQASGSLGVELLLADLSDQSAVRGAASEFARSHAELHVLVNNAGAHVTHHQESVDHIELNLAINHLSAFLLTNLLLDMMKASGHARVVNVASQAMTKSIDLDVLRQGRPGRPTTSGKFRPFEVYGQAKLAMVLCGYALARRTPPDVVTVNALHPGITATKILDDVSPPYLRPFLGIIKRFLSTPEQGAQTAIMLATDAELATVTGRYFIKGRDRPSVPASYDERLQDETWELSARLVGLGAAGSGAGGPRQGEWRDAEPPGVGHLAPPADEVSQPDAGDAQTPDNERGSL